MSSLSTLTASTVASSDPDAAPAYRCQTIDALNQLDTIAESWRTLGDQQAGPMEQFEWAAACTTQPINPVRIRIAAVHRGTSLAAVAALGVQRLRGVPRRVLLGVQEHYEPTEFLADDVSSLRELAGFLARDTRPFVIGRIPAQSPTVCSLKKAFAGRGLIFEREEAGSPYLPLDDSWCQPEQHLSSRRRGDLRRARRRAEQRGELTAEVIIPSMENLNPLLDEAFHVEQQSWKGEAQTALTCDPIRGDFFRKYAANLCRQESLRLCFLRIDGRPIAMQIGVVASDRFWLLKIGYDAEFSHCSPGVLLVRESIAHAARAGLTGYEFLGRLESWIEIWNPQVRECKSLRIYPISLSGGTALIADSAASSAVRMKQRYRDVARKLRSGINVFVLPIVKRAARGYIAGDTLADAERVQRRLVSQSVLTTIGFWDAEGQSSREVADQYLAGLDLLGSDEHDGYLSIKLPALQFSAKHVNAVVDRARTVDRRIHFDALAPDIADRMKSVVGEIVSSAPDLRVGYTLPGRWRRSEQDADWVADNSLFVRVVKGQWADPEDPDRDLREGFLNVIDRLAGRAHHVSVATHDIPLAAEAIRRLRQQGTACDMELLFGLPQTKSMRQARKLGLPVRVYVPYGAAYLPYAVERLRKNPHVLFWLCKDFLSNFTTTFSPPQRSTSSKAR